MTLRAVVESQIRSLRAGQPAMPPETLERILAAIPGEPDYVRLNLYNMDYSSLTPQLQGIVEGLEVTGKTNTGKVGEEFYAIKPTKGLVIRIHASTLLWQERENRLFEKTYGICKALNEGRVSKEAAEAEIAALDRGIRPAVKLVEASWRFPARPKPPSERVSLTPEGVTVKYAGNSPPSYAEALFKAVEGTRVNIELHGMDRRNPFGPLFE